MELEMVKQRVQRWFDTEDYILNSNWSSIWALRTYQPKRRVLWIKLTELFCFQHARRMTE